MFTAAITGLIAAATAYTAATGSEDRAYLGFVALFMGSVSVMMLTTLRPPGPRWSSVELEGRPAWRLALGPAQPVPAVALVLTILGLGLAWLAVMIAVGSTGGAVVVAALVGLLAAFLLAVAAQLWLTWARPPSLVVSAHLRYAGVGVVVDLGWDDVATVEHADRTTRWACVTVSARAGAASYRCRRRWTLLPVDRVPDPPGLEVRYGLLADVPQLVRLLRELHVGGRATRESLISLGLPEVSGR